MWGAVEPRLLLLTRKKKQLHRCYALCHELRVLCSKVYM